MNATEVAIIANAVVDVAGIVAVTAVVFRLARQRRPAVPPTRQQAPSGKSSSGEGSQ